MTTREALQTIERNATAQADLIEDILDVTRIASGKITLERVNVDLVAVLREAAQSLQPSLGARRLTLDMRVPPQSAIVFADPKRYARSSGT